MIPALPSTPSTRLLAKFELAFPAVAAQAERLWASPDIRFYYPIYLRTMHMIVRAAVPLITAALEQARLLAGGDRLAAGLIDYFTRHAKEEAGHDVWLLEDLAMTGADPGLVLNALPSANAATLVGAQYYWLRHYHPMSLLGHIAAIETYHPPPGFADRLQRLTGYPQSAFRAIARHEILDIKHKREIHALIDSLGLDDVQETMLGISGLHTLWATMEILEEIAEARSPAAARPGVRGHASSPVESAHGASIN